jgi:hypothetical protein
MRITNRCPDAPPGVLPRFGRLRRLLPEISDTCTRRLERTPDNRLRMEQIRLPTARVP